MPRLIGLAVAEAVDASRLELVAVAEPPASRATGEPPAVRAPSDWTIAFVAAQRAFSAQAGVGLLGIGLMPARRLTAHWSASIDTLVENATVLTGSGAVSVVSVSSAPRIAYRVGDGLYGELGAGGRVGIVRMVGESLPHSTLVGARLVRGWCGPAATVGIGIALPRGIDLAARYELGVVASGATARDLGQPAASVGGVWQSLAVAAAVAL